MGRHYQQVAERPLAFQLQSKEQDNCSKESNSHPLCIPVAAHCHTGLGESPGDGTGSHPQFNIISSFENKITYLFPLHMTTGKEKKKDKADKNTLIY